MTPEEINRTIAEDRGWKFVGTCTFHGVAATPVFQNNETGEQRCDLNYLDEKNPGPVHELIEVLRGEGWRWTCTAYRDNYVCEFYRPKGDASHRVTASTFCRAVCEAYLKVRGKWTD